MRNALIAMAAMMGLGMPGANAGVGQVRRDYPQIDDIKYAPRALPKGRSGDKLRRKAREGKLGIAVLR